LCRPSFPLPFSGPSPPFFFPSHRPVIIFLLRRGSRGRTTWPRRPVNPAGCTIRGSGVSPSPSFFVSFSIPAIFSLPSFPHSSCRRGAALLLACFHPYASLSHLRGFFCFPALKMFFPSTCYVCGWGFPLSCLLAFCRTGFKTPPGPVSSLPQSSRGNGHATPINFRSVTCGCLSPLSFPNTFFF